MAPRALINTIWATIGVWGQQVFSFLTSIVLARMLDPDAFGVVTIAMLFILLIQRALVESVVFAIVRAPDISTKYLCSAFFSGIGLAVILSSAPFLMSKSLAKALNVEGMEQVLRALAVIPLLDGISCVHLGLLRRGMHFKSLAKRTMLANAIGGGVGISAAMYGAGVWSLVAQQIVTSILSSAALWYSSSWRPAFTIDRAEVVKIAKFGVPMIGSSAFYVAANRIDIVFLGAFFDIGTVGVYSVAKRILRLVIDGAMAGFNAVSLSSLTVEQDKDDRKAVFMRNLRFATFLVFPVFTWISISGGELIEVMLGSKWREAGPVLQVLALFGYSQVAILLCTNLLVSYGKTRALLFVNFIAFALLVTLLTVSTEFGAVGVAAAVSAQGFLTTLLLARHVQYRIAVSGTELVGTIKESLFANAILALVLFGVSLSIQTASSEIVVAASAVSALVTYAVCGMTVARKTAEEILVVVRSTIRRPNRLA